MGGQVPMNRPCTDARSAEAAEKSIVEYAFIASEWDMGEGFNIEISILTSLKGMIPRLCFF